MDKLQMAQDYIIAEVRRVGICSIDEDKIMDAWKVADAMQAEADKRKPCGLPDALREEWQPDWSQAPDDACCWFIGGKSWDVKPYWSKYIPCYKSEETQTTWQGDGMVEAPSFGYTGNWQDSLRERPNGF